MPLPTPAELHALFTQVNEDCMAGGEKPVPFSDTDYYADQIANIYEIESEATCLELANQLANFKE